MSSPRRLAIYGGSFDPVHLGHLQVATAAREACDLDLVVFVPCRQSPHKHDGPIASEQERLEMLSLAVQDLPWAEVSELEMQLPPPSFSWITAESMREIYPATRLYWLMGADQWAVINSWARSDHFADLVEFIVHDRGKPPEPRPGFRTHFVHGDHPASATALRAQAPEALRSEWLPEKVEQFIRSRGLYGCRS